MPYDRPLTPRKRRGVVAVIVRDGRLLVIQRSSLVRAPLAWCFPGGGIEEGESEETALVRELQEELAVTVQPVRLLYRNISPWKFDLAWWLAELDPAAAITPHPAEVAIVDWLNVTQIRKLPDLLRSNHDFLDALERGEFRIDGLVLKAN